MKRLPTSDEHTREAWLYKRGGRTGFKGWDRRWCVYRNGRLSYFLEQTDTKPQGNVRGRGLSHNLTPNHTQQGEIPLTSMVAVRWTPTSSDSKYLNRFELETHERIYYFSADTSDEMTRWMTLLGIEITMHKPPSAVGAHERACVCDH